MTTLVRDMLLSSARNFDKMRHGKPTPAVWAGMLLAQLGDKAALETARYILRYLEAAIEEEKAA